MQNTDSVSDQRQQSRQSVAAGVVVAMPGHPPVSLTTANYSDGGVFLLYSANDKPAVGTEIIVTLNEFLGSDDPMAMVARVVHTDERGMGIEFVGPAE
jgi:hypothetical protein